MPEITENICCLSYFIDNATVLGNRSFRLTFARADVA